VSSRGQSLLRATSTLTSTEAGEIHVEEYGYGLGPPTGILVLRYPATGVVAEFPESRNDYVHQVFWSPDGPLAVRRGAATGFIGPGEALWVRRGVVAEVAALGVQTVLRCCVRQAPAALTDEASASLTMTETAAAAVLAIARPGVEEAAGLAGRATLLTELATVRPRTIDHAPAQAGPVHVVTAALVRDPADPTGLAEWARRLHVSTKTLQREFERAHGVPFTTWRTRTRLRASLAMLPRWSVTETAHRVGYASASAYVAAFTREFGTTPRQHVLRALPRAAG
jgi:AraC-like DNA-binding protein